MRFPHLWAYLPQGIRGFRNMGVPPISSILVFFLHHKPSILGYHRFVISAADVESLGFMG